MKAISVFSGGLDSMLVAQLIRGQGIEVQAFFFETPFFKSPRARKSAGILDLPIKVVDITDRHLEIVMNPVHGYGGNMNPCIDCHTLMLRIAGEMLRQEGAGFVISGEVLGQRPMSQNRKALSTVAVESGFEGFILRPLSAKRLPMTIPEREGWVSREALMDFSGRSRKPQMALAKKLGIETYPSPAGGCLLTDEIFSRRLKDLFASGSIPETRALELLKLGRHFRVGPKTKLIVGRNRIENQAIGSLSNEEDIMIRTTDIPGPTVLLIGDFSPELEHLASVMTVSYSDAKDDESAEVRFSGKGMDKRLRVRGQDKSELKKYMI